MYDGTITVLAKIDTKQYDAQIEKMEGEVEQLTTLLNNSSGKLSGDDVAKYTVELEKAKNKLIDLKQKRDELNNKTIDLSGINNGVKKIISSVEKWALAVFSVKSLFGLVRGSISTLTKYDKQMSADIEYLRYSLAVALKPVIEYIVNLIYKMMAYINYISIAWFKVNLFANASAKNFSKSNTEAKKLQKTLAGFDELNTVGSSSTSASGGITMPSFDLSKIENVKIPDWVDKIAQNKNNILTWAKTFAGLFALSKITKMLSNLGLLWKGSTGLSALGSTLLNLGVIAGGIAITYLCAKQVWTDAKNLKQEIKEIQKKGAAAWEDQLAKQTSSKAIEEQMNVKRNAGLENLKNQNLILGWITGNYNNMINNAKSVVTYGEQALTKEMEIYKTGKQTAEDKRLLLGSIQDQIAYNDKVIAKLKVEGLETKEIEESNKRIKQLAKDIGVEIEGDTKNTSGLVSTGNTANQAFKNVLDKVKEINNTNLKDKKQTTTLEVKANTKSAGTKLTSFFSDVVKAAGLSMTVGAGSSASKAVNSSINSIIGEIKNLKFASGGIVKCASGSVVNMPGRGIDYGGANIGERGPEGVIPLTNSHSMTMLGEAIGRYITINASITNTMNGRVISRELQRINNSNDFASNR